MPVAPQSGQPSVFPTGISHSDLWDWLPNLPRGQVDLLFLDPPYNLRKSFNGHVFQKSDPQAYTKWLDELLVALKPLMRETATIYLCGDWFTSVSIFEAASRHFIVRNRITWEREKGRGAKSNYKNSSEDIWFCTMSKEYCFNGEDVKLRRRVVAPYTDQRGSPKDWTRTSQGDFRDTHVSNLWTDISVPFWSMPENTDHPTQKSEKLVAKLMLASTRPGDMVFDPFCGSGTTCVVAEKLGRQSFGIEIDLDYALLGISRTQRAREDRSIQGFAGGVFWERNTASDQQRAVKQQLET